MSKPRILVALNNFRNFGGASNMALNLASLMKDDCNFVFCGKKGRFAEKIRNSGFDCVQFSSITPPLLVPLFILYKSIKLKIDLIHSHSCFLGGILGLLLKMSASKIPLCVTSHILTLSRGPKKLSVFLLNNFVNKVFAVAEHGRKAMIGWGISGKKIKTIYNCVDMGRFSSPLKESDYRSQRKQYYAIMTGRLVEAKRFDIFIKTIFYVQKIGYDINGIIVGAGPKRKDLEILANQLEIADKIEFTGYSSTVEKHLSKSDVFLFPSHHQEILPIALLEAAATGLPIVASNIPGNSEVVADGQTGYLVDDIQNEKIYGDRIIELICDRALYDTFSRKSKQTIKNKFSSDHVTGLYLKEYLSLITNS